jgi:predicted nucleic acid-binding protein
MQKKMQSGMQTIVIDTNFVVSALIGSSYPRQIIYNLVFEKKVIVCL